MSDSKTMGGHLRVRYRPVTAISVAHIRQMFALQLRQDSDTSLDDFVRKLCNKSGVVLATASNGRQVIGYKIVSTMHLVFDGVRVTGVFSEPGVWSPPGNEPGARAATNMASLLGEALFDELTRMHVAHPLTRLVWLSRTDDAAGSLAVRTHCRRLNLEPPQSAPQAQEAATRLSHAFARRLFPQDSEGRRPTLCMGDVDVLDIMVCLTLRPWRWFRRNILRNYRAAEPQVARQSSITPQHATWQDSDATEAMERGETS